MTRPGIVLARSGFYFAVKRLETAEKAHVLSPSGETEANVVRNGCETLFWLFVLNEDFKELIETETSQTIHEWWSTQGVNGDMMSAMRFIRNRVTHSYKYYWKVWDLNTLKWGAIDPPTQEELGHKNGKYMKQQYADYRRYIEGEDMGKPLISVVNVMEKMFLKFDLSNL
jgi:hypothetical protein